MSMTDERANVSVSHFSHFDSNYSHITVYHTCLDETGATSRLADPGVLVQTDDLPADLMGL